MDVEGSLIFGFAVQVYLEILGENKIAESKVTLKNMKTGNQEIYTREEVARNIK